MIMVLTNSGIFILLFAMFLGGVAMYFGIQILYNSDVFFQKMIVSKKYEVDSFMYNFLTNKSNKFFHKIWGLGGIFIGLTTTLFTILRLLGKV